MRALNLKVTSILNVFVYFLDLRQRRVLNQPFTVTSVLAVKLNSIFYIIYNICNYYIILICKKNIYNIKKNIRRITRIGKY